MKTPIQPKTAATIRAGNYNDELAKAWLAYNQGSSPRSTTVLGEIADEALRQLLRKGTLCGALSECEEDLRQDAAELLFCSLLRGNQDLTNATAAGDIDEIARQIGRSIAAAAKFGRERFIRKAQQEIQRRALLAQAVEDGVLIQTAQEGFGLNHEARMKLALAALTHAVRSGHTSRESAAMARSFLSGEKLQKELAEEHGISPAAASKRLKRAAEAARAIIERGEVEL